MTKNIKSIFFVLTLVMLLVTVGAVCATDDTNSTVTVDRSVSVFATVSDSASDTVAAEPITTTSNNKADTKTIEKEEKNLKKEPKTIDGVEYTKVYENIVLDSNYYVYEYGFGTLYFEENTFVNNCTIPSNNIGNCFIYSDITVLINNTNISLSTTSNGNLTLNNTKVNNTLQNRGELIVINSTLDCTLYNYNNLTIDDNTIFDKNFNIIGNGPITINDTIKLIPYLSTLNGTYILENMTFNKNIQNYGNITLNNCTITKDFTNYNNMNITNSFINNGNINNYNNGTTIIRNSILSGRGNIYNAVGITEIYNSTLNLRTNNYGTLIIGDNVTFGSEFTLTNGGTIIINDSNRIYPYLTTFTGNNTLNNLSIDKSITNNGDMSIDNSIINKQLTNNGNLTLSNTTINSTINNNGNLTITDDCIIAENCKITGNGQITINNTNKIAPYLTTYNGNYTLENTTINTTKTNLGNLTIINSTLNGTSRIRFSNNGNLTIKNSTLNLTIINNGNLTITDDCIIAENCQITGNGKLIMNDTTRVGIYSGNIIKDNTVINSSITIPNEGNVTFLNSNITAPITNNGNITFTNCNITALITNNNHITLLNCSLSNNNLTTPNRQKTDGFLINNIGNLTLIHCIIENNTFNTTYNGYVDGSSHVIYGAIFNHGFMDVINSSFKNNSVGFYRQADPGYNGYFQIGEGSCIRNEGTLTINSNEFIDNYAGYQAGAISSSNNLTINNSKYINNSAHTSGGALVVSRANITNTLFENNNLISNYTEASNSIGSGGAIKSSNDLNIENCTFDSNYAISQSTWLSTQGGGAISTSGTSTITNSTFKNNYVISPEGVVMPEEWGGKREPGMGGAIKSSGNITITHNQFINNSASINGSAIYLSGGYNLITINNNTFSDNKESTETIYIKYYNTTTNIQDNTYTNTSIGFKKLELTGPNKAYTEDNITITLNIELEHPEFYDQDILEQTDYLWYISGNTTTDKETEKTITVGNENIITYVKPTISDTRTKVLAITPTILNDIIITPDNINNYVFEGELIVSANSRLIFQGEFNNIGEIYNNKNEIFFDGTNATFTNTAFVIEANNNTIQNMNINNTDTSNYIMTIIGSDNTIQNNTLNQYNSNGKTAAIYNNNGNNNKITQNTIKVSGPALAITYEAGATTANTQGILSVGGQNNTITYNMITVTNSTDSDQSQFGTIEAITAPQGTNNNISYNTIRCTGARFNYGINTLENVQGNSITYNNITVTGYRYTDGIQVGNGATGNLIANNNINLTCLNTTPVDEAAISYGVIITSQGGQISDNNTITQNNITINGAVNYGMEIYTSTNTFITENNISLTGVKSMGIGYAHSPNSIVTDNNITINDDSTGTLNSVTEEIQPLSVGIRVQQESNNIQIENNTITTNDVAKTDKTIDTTDANTVIKNNQLTSSSGYGAETIKTTQTDTVIENNTIETTTTITVPETIITNTPVTLTATVTIDETPINGGLITFTKDNEVLAQSEVIDGVATTTVTFKEEEDATIIASYTPESTGLSTSSAEATTSIQAPQTQLNIEDVQLTAGQTVTLTAKVTDQAGNNITGGKVVFKLNGKTVKDANGKVIYAKVVDGVATVEYTVADNMNGKDLNITATYSGTNKYNKATTSITTTVEKTTPTFTTESITATAGATIQLKANITDGDKVINTGKVVFKINGKTVKDENGKVIYAKVVNNHVIVNYTLPADMKAKDYNITATFISSDYERLDDTKVLSVTA